MKYVIPTIKKKFNRFYIPRAQKLNDLVIFFTLTFGAFLPVRWFFYGYVTHNVLPNMGIVTLIAILMFVLVRSGKLGFIGDAFNRQMIRFAASKTFKRVLIFSLALSLYTGVPLLFMERGEFVYQDELQMFDANSIRSNYLQNYVINNTEPIMELAHKEYMSISDFCDLRPKECIINYDDIEYEEYKFVMLNDKLPSPESFDMVNNMTLMESYNYNMDLANNYDFLFSVAMHLANVNSGGWTGHFSTVWFVEEIEAIGLFFLYRRWYLKHSIGEPWLGVYDENLKRIMYKTKKHDKLYHGRSTKPEDKRPIITSIIVVLFAICLKVVAVMFSFEILGWLSLVMIFFVIIYLFKITRRKKK